MERWSNQAGATEERTSASRWWQRKGDIRILGFILKQGRKKEWILNLREHKSERKPKKEEDDDGKIDELDPQF